MQVTKEAFERIKNALKKELGEAQRKIKNNKSQIAALAKEQRTFKSELGGLYAMLRELDGKSKKVSKKHRKQN